MPTEDLSQKKRLSKKHLNDTPGAAVTEELNAEELAERAKAEQDIIDGEATIREPGAPGVVVEPEAEPQAEVDPLSELISRQEELINQDEVNSMLILIEQVCAKHAAIAKSAGRNGVAHDFKSLQGVARSLSKRVKNLKYWEQLS